MKQLLFEQSAREKLMQGVNIITNAVKVTLGPKGRNVILDKTDGTLITNDGVTIAKEIQLENKFENMGAKLVQEVANKTQDVSGDGTTTATILAQQMLCDGMKNIAAGANPIEIKYGIDHAAKQVVSFIQQKSIPVENKILQVATISANNDDAIGNIIAQAMNKVGNTGVITVQDGRGFETSLNLVEGMQFNRGYTSPFMVTNQDKMVCEFQDAYVLIVNKKISTMKQLIPSLEIVAKQGKPLLIIAEDIEDEAEATLLLNLMRGAIKVCAVKAPGFGDEQKEMLQDIAVATGATVVGDMHQCEDVTINMLGSIRRVTVTKDRTTLVEGQGDKIVIKQRCTMLENQILNEESSFRKKDLKQRLAKLSEGVAVISVGAATETEMKEKKMRIDDALNATRAAVEEGVVTGGGLTLYQAREAINTNGLSKDRVLGAEIVRNALQAPVRQIAENAGVPPERVLMKTEGDTGFNARTHTIENLFNAGIIDPTKVVRSGVQNAASIAGMVLSTSVIITDKE